MNLVESLRVALIALRTNLMRSVLTMLGIIIGVASVSTMVTLGRGAQAHIDAQIEALGTNLLLVVPAAADSGGVRLGAGTRLRLTEADAQALKNQIPEIVASAATINAQVQLVVGNRNWQTALQGVDSDYLIARNWATSLGRSFDGYPSPMARCARRP